MTEEKHNVLYTLCREYKSLKDNIADYIDSFGCFCNVIISPYFHISTILGIVTVLKADAYGSWANVAISILPCLLGFSIGGYAILMSFGDDKFRKFIATFRPKGEKNPLMMIVNGTFLHFILIQMVASLIAIIVYLNKINDVYINILGCTVFYYAFTFCAAAAFEIKTVGRWYQMFIDADNNKRNKTQNPDPECDCDRCRKRTQ